MTTTTKNILNILWFIVVYLLVQVIATVIVGMAFLMARGSSIPEALGSLSGGFLTEPTAIIVLTAVANTTLILLFLGLPADSTLARPQLDCIARFVHRDSVCMDDRMDRCRCPQWYRKGVESFDERWLRLFIRRYSGPHCRRDSLSRSYSPLFVHTFFKAYALVAHRAVGPDLRSGSRQYGAGSARCGARFAVRLDVLPHRQHHSRHRLALGEQFGCFRSL